MTFNPNMWPTTDDSKDKNFVDVTRDKIIKNSDAFIDENVKYTTEQKEVFKQKIELALSLALEIHKDQKPRPDGPYVNHILRVSNRIMEEYGIEDPELLIAALLHDSVEDQAKKLAMLLKDINSDSERKKALLYIQNNFGERVTKIVTKLSNPEVEKEGMETEEKNSIYKEHVKEAIEDLDVLPIKLSDFSDNALNLDAVTDPERRLKLSIKYLPLIEVFIERLKTAQDILSEEKIVEMSDRLYSELEKIKDFINSQNKNESSNNSQEVLDSLTFHDDERFVSMIKKMLEGKDISVLKDAVIVNLESGGRMRNTEDHLSFAREKITEKDDQKILLYAMQSLSSFQKESPQINTLLAKKNVRFTQFPFSAETLVGLFTKESDIKVDEGELSKQRNEELVREIRMIRHIIGNSRGSEDLSSYPPDRLEQFLQRSKKAFPDLTDKTDKEVFDFMYSIEFEVPEKMKDQIIEGVYCDVEGTLMVNGELNNNVLNKLKEYEAQGKQITIWTDGDLEELTQKLRSLGVQYPIKSKFDFGGANAEIVIDNDDQNTFFAKTRIFPKEFIKV